MVEQAASITFASTDNVPPFLIRCFAASRLNLFSIPFIFSILRERKKPIFSLIMGYRLTLLCYIDVRYTVFSFAQKREFKILIIVDKLTRLQIINTLPSFHDPRSSIATMPSQFSGLFYVNEIINRDLHCYFMNENGDALPLTITYFYTRLIADSTAAYIQVHAKKIYWLQGI